MIRYSCHLFLGLAAFRAVWVGDARGAMWDEGLRGWEERDEIRWASAVTKRAILTARVACEARERRRACLFNVLVGLGCREAASRPSVSWRLGNH